MCLQRLAASEQIGLDIRYVRLLQTDQNPDFPCRCVQYHTWDSLRGLNITGGLVNSVGVRPNRTYGGYPGLERFYAPGRNYAVSLEWKF